MTTTTAAPLGSADQTSAAANKPTANRYLVLSMLLVAYTFNFVDRQILGILAGAIKKDLSLTDSDLGLMGGLAFAVFYTGLGMPVASLADRWSRTSIMTGALALWSAFTAACGMVSGFGALFACRMGVGVGEAGGVAPAYSLISDYFPKEQRARALAVYSFGIPIGSAAGYLFGGLIASAVSWRAAFIVVGVAGLVLAPVFWWVVKEPPRVTGAAAVAKPAFMETVKVLLPKPSFWLLALGAAASSVFGYGVAFWLPSFAERSMGLNLEQRSVFLAGVVLIGGMAGIWAGGWIADRLGKARRDIYPVIPAIAVLIAIPLFYAALNLAVSPPAAGVVESSGDFVLRLAPAFLLFLVPQALSVVWLGPVVTSVQHLVPAPMRSTASAAFLFINNLVGIGFGTFYFGKVSDLLKPSFGADSIRISITSGLAFYVISAGLFLVARTKLVRDWVE